MADPTPPSKWTDAYRGRDGYDRMYAELTGSFFKEFPELKGKATAYKFSNDPQAEAGRIGAELGIDPARVAQQQGLAVTHFVADKESPRRMIAYGFDPLAHTEGQDWNQVTPEIIRDAAWHLTHELYHTADHILNASRYEAKVDDTNQTKWQESFADAGRVGLFIKNTGSQPDATGTKSFVITYDNDRPYYFTNWGNHSLIGENREQALKETIPERYDNGPLLLDIYKHTSPIADARDYRFVGWRDTFAQVTAARDEWDAVAIQSIPLQNVAAITLNSAAERFKGEAEIALAPYADDISRLYKSTVGDAVSELFDAPGLATAKSSDPAEVKILSTVLASRQDFLNWAGDRIEFLPSAERMIGAYAYNLGITDEVGIYKNHKLTDLQGMSRALSSYLKTGDPLDREAAELFSLTAHGHPVDQKQMILRELYINPVLLDRLAAPDAAPAPKPEDPAPKIKNPTAIPVF